MSSENQDSGMSHKEFLEKALTTAGEWARFADPKALGVAVFLSFGATDLLMNAGRLYYGFTKNSSLEWTTTMCFLGALLIGVLTVLFVSLALFPRLKPKGPDSLFYFGSIAQMSGPEKYEQEVKKLRPQDLESQIAHQTWNVAKTAAAKHKWTQRAYFSLLVFVAFWVAGRIALSFIQ
jgi:hypothetical protein